MLCNFFLSKILLHSPQLLQSLLSLQSPQSCTAIGLQRLHLTAPAPLIAIAPMIAIPDCNCT